MKKILNNGSSINGSSTFYLYLILFVDLLVSISFSVYFSCFSFLHYFIWTMKFVPSIFCEDYRRKQNFKLYANVKFCKAVISFWLRDVWFLDYAMFTWKIAKYNNTANDGFVFNPDWNVLCFKAGCSFLHIYGEGIDVQFFKLC